MKLWAVLRGQDDGTYCQRVCEKPNNKEFYSNTLLAHNVTNTIAGQAL
jgi:hypothetical protein